MAIKIRYKAPTGGGTLDLDQNALVSDLFAALKESTGASDVVIKYGWPPKTLPTADSANATLLSLGLQRESLTVIPVEAPPPPPPKKKRDIKDQNVTVEIAPGNYLVLRVMPDDNSCLFTAVGGAVRNTRPGLDDPKPETLRRMVTQHILSHPEKYTEAILDNKAPDKYCANMMKKDTWGGGIELGVLSDIFDMEICAINVEDGAVLRFGEDRHSLRCIVVFSGIHYDRVAQIFDPDQVGADFDVTTWSAAESDHVVDGAVALVKKLKEEFKYFVSLNSMLVRCLQCEWLGQGETAVVKHASLTGHSRTEVIPDGGPG